MIVPPSTPGREADACGAPDIGNGLLNRRPEAGGYPFFRFVELRGADAQVTGLQFGMVELGCVLDQCRVAAFLYSGYDFSDHWLDFLRSA